MYHEHLIDEGPRWWHLPDGLVIWAELFKIEHRAGKVPVVMLHLVNYLGGILMFENARKIGDVHPGDGSEPREVIYYNAET